MNGWQLYNQGDGLDGYVGEVEIYYRGFQRMAFVDTQGRVLLHKDSGKCFAAGDVTLIKLMGQG